MNSVQQLLFFRPANTFCIAVIDKRTNTVTFVRDSDPNDFELTTWLGDAETWGSINAVQEVVARMRISRGDLLTITPVAIKPIYAEYMGVPQHTPEMKDEGAYKDINILNLHSAACQDEASQQITHTPPHTPPYTPPYTPPLH